MYLKDRYFLLTTIIHRINRHLAALLGGLLGDPFREALLGDLRGCLRLRAALHGHGVRDALHGLRLQDALLGLRLRGCFLHGAGLGGHDYQGGRRQGAPKQLPRDAYPMQVTIITALLAV